MVIKGRDAKDLSKHQVHLLLTLFFFLTLFSYFLQICVKYLLCGSCELDACISQRNSVVPMSIPQGEEMQTSY